MIGPFMQNLWPFTVIITTDACTQAFHIYIIEVTEKQMQIAFIVFLTCHPVVFSQWAARPLGLLLLSSPPKASAAAPMTHAQDAQITVTCNATLLSM